MPDLSQINFPNDNNNPYDIKDASVPHSSLPAASSGIDLSLVTTGEKYTWNNGCTDTKVTQTFTGAEGTGQFPILFSGTADTTTRTEGARKANYLTFEPSYNGGRLNSSIIRAEYFTIDSLYGNYLRGIFDYDGIQLRSIYNEQTVELNSNTGNISALSLNGATIGSSPEFTDAKVTQTATSNNADYEVLFSGTADNTTRTEGAGKADRLIYNPDKGWLLSKLTYTDVTKSDNDVSADRWQGVLLATDKNGKIISTFENSVRTDGRVSTALLVRNYDTTGTQVSNNKGITVFMDKSGNATYGVSDTANFRSAIGLVTGSVTYTTTKTSGHWSIKNIDAYRYGNCVHMVITFNGDGTNISSGGTGFIGTITSGPKPAVVTRGFMLQGTVMGFVNIEADGQITAKAHTGTINLASSSNALVVFNFICP